MAAGREIERKFLVSAIPDNRGPGTRILQGYLPLASEDTEVRVRRKGAETVLTVKQGRGLDRGEREVAISAEVFETLWPLTEGRRIEKTRYELPQGDVDRRRDQTEIPIALNGRRRLRPSGLAGDYSRSAARQRTSRTRRYQEGDHGQGRLAHHHVG